MQAKATPTTNPNPIFLEPAPLAEAGSSAADDEAVELDPDFFVAGEGAAAGDLVSENSAGNNTLST
ncbi:MAG: hypothetical protein Q8807_03600 ['Waltheria sp.' little leaf phytoplasma]|nr:hypothetical protein ['Waltheria sp.' little leaf phytoplasma]